VLPKPPRRRAESNGPARPLRRLCCTARTRRAPPSPSAGRSPRLAFLPGRHLPGRLCLCADHARLVDNNRGTRFSAQLLREYRSLHEARVAREQGGIVAPLGWFHKVGINSAPVFATPAQLDLGKVTVITGANGTGKTALWQWTAGIGDATYLRRWLGIPRPRDPLNITVTYFDPLERTVGVCIEDQQIWYTVEGRSVPFQPYTVRFVVPKHPRDIREWERMDDQSRLHSVFDLPDTGIAKLMETWSPARGFITGLELAKDSDERRVSVRLRGSDFYLGLRQISSGELMVVLVEIAIAIAAFFSQYTPTVLVLDDVVGDLDDSGLQSTIEWLGTREMNFQTIVTVPQRAIDYAALFDAGAYIVGLEGRAPSVEIVPGTR